MRLREKLSYANVVATLALFLALTGSAVYAAGRIGTRDIEPKAVKAGKLARKAVKSGKIVPGAIKGRVDPRRGGGGESGPGRLDRSIEAHLPDRPRRQPQRRLGTNHLGT